MSQEVVILQSDADCSERFMAFKLDIARFRRSLMDQMLDGKLRNVDVATLLNDIQTLVDESEQRYGEAMRAITGLRIAQLNELNVARSQILIRINNVLGDENEMSVSTVRSCETLSSNDLYHRDTLKPTLRTG